jgi:tripartite-type tricarboxylate transporter receptor subunit TctC
MLAPAGTPRDVVNRLAGDMAKAVKLPDVVQRMGQLGIDPVGSTPEAYGQVNKAANDKYAAVVKATGAKID